mmetsp:Transcript_99113/g.175637  ORF Transcript_99113/g.175637 Transcript_99113/m.175637 type:complete len:208 (+) Transcript_99113:128-751(+)
MNREEPAAAWSRICATDSLQAATQGCRGRVRTSASLLSEDLFICRFFSILALPKLNVFSKLIKRLFGLFNGPSNYLEERLNDKIHKANLTFRDAGHAGSAIAKWRNWNTEASFFVPLSEELLQQSISPSQHHMLWLRWIRDISCMQKIPQEAELVISILLHVLIGRSLFSWRHQLRILFQSVSNFFQLLHVLVVLGGVGCKNHVDES